MARASVPEIRFSPPDGGSSVTPTPAGGGGGGGGAGDMARASVPEIRFSPPDGGSSVTPTPAGGGGGGGGAGDMGSGGAAGEGSDGASSSGGVYRYFYIGGTANAYPGSTVTMARRYKASNATLIGYSEWVNPAVPPKKYRTLTLSGEVYSCQWIDVTQNCGAGYVYTDRVLYGGTYSVNAAGVLTANTLLRSKWTGSPPTPTTSPCGNPATFLGATNPWSGTYPIPYEIQTAAPAPAWSTPLIGDYPLIQTAVYNPTTVDYSWNGSCNRNTSPSYTQSSAKALGAVSWVLTDEDTDATAIARMLAATSWTSFANFPSNQLSTYTGATWNQRTAFTFAYSEIELRLTITGFPPSINFSVVAAFATMENDTLQVWSTDGVTVDSTTDGSGGAVVTIPCVAQRAGTTRFIYALNYIRR